MNDKEMDILKNEIQKLKQVCEQYNMGNDPISYDDSYSEIIENIYKANLDKDKSTNEDLAFITLTLGNMAYGDGNYEMSLEYFNAATNLYHQLDDKANMAMAVQGTTDSYFMLEQYSKVMEYNPIVMNYYKEKGEKSKEADAAYYAAEASLKLDNFNDSATYACKALDLYKSINDDANVAYCYNQLGRIYFCDENFKSAAENYKKSIVIRESLGLLSSLPLTTTTWAIHIIGLIKIKRQKMHI